MENTIIENPETILPNNPVIKKTRVLKKKEKTTEVEPPQNEITNNPVIEPETKKKSRVLKKTDKKETEIEPPQNEIINNPVIEPETKKKKGENVEIQIVLDERERDLYQEIQKIKTDIPISKKVLNIGDVLIQSNDDKPLLIIERKSLQDLLASIKDGRYTEQSFRLLNSSGLPCHQILYCIEGMMSSIKTQEEEKRIYSAVTSIHYYKGMSVLRTWSVQETAELLVRTAEKIKRETANGKLPYQSPVSCVSGDLSVQKGGEYSQTLVSSVKAENITPENIGEIMLSQIPSVSIASAKALLAVFNGNLIRFLEALKNNNPVLQEIYFVNETGKKRRKISGKCLENIRRLLLPQLVG